MSGIVRIPRLADRIVVSATATVAGGYIAGLLVAELALVQGGLLAGAICHAILLVALLVHHIAAPATPYHSLLLGLALLPLIRLFGLAVPVAELPYLFWHVMVGIPTALAALFAIRAEEIEPKLMGIGSRFDPAVQFAVSIVGVPLGLMAWFALRPAPVVEVGVLPIALGVIIAVVFVAGLEEFVFRGLLQGVALQALGSSTGAVAVSATAYAVLLVPSLSVPFIVVMFGAAVFFGWVVEVTGSLYGVIGAHALLAVGLLVVWPMLLGIPR
jgi:uncharacterized protein